jgi:hypothetical protein
VVSFGSELLVKLTNVICLTGPVSDLLHDMCVPSFDI